MSLAIFDIDGTLVAGPSTEKRFFLWLLRHSRLGPRQLAAFVWFNVRWLHRYGRYVAKKNKAYLSGQSRLEIEQQATLFMAEEIEKKLFAPAVEQLRRHQALGDTVILLSGTLVPIARALGRRLGVAHIIATESRLRDERYVSAPPTLHPFGAGKLSLLAPLCDQYGVAARDVHAYADSIHDVHLLNAVGHPVAVRPDQGLRNIACARGWPVIAETGSQRMTNARRDPI